MGIGAICHTVNPRLFPDQIAWIINHAEDRVVMTDLTFVPMLEKIAGGLPSVERYIVLTDRAHMPQTTLKNAVAYEDWIAEVDGKFQWKNFDENTAAAMCYTSGTTGDPKGVLYSHRSNVLHALIANSKDALGTSAADTMLPVVPLFHANSWGIAFSAPSMGTKLVMPGAKLDGASVYELLDAEKVTHTAGVPTVWLMLLNHMSAGSLKLPHLRMVVCGGSAMPRSMIKSFVDMGVEPRHAWGMTEMSPLGTLATLKPPFDALEGEARLDILQTQGYPPFGVEMKITDDAGKPNCPGTARPSAGSRFRDPRSRRPISASIPIFSTRKATSTPATSPPSTRTATCGSPTAPRTSSSPAANGFRRSTWKTSLSATPRSPKRP